METSIRSHHKNVGTLIHLSTFSKFFFPFGNFLAPLILWSMQKRDSLFIDEHGRGAINFQLSILLYMVGLIVFSIPFFVYFVISAGGGSEQLIEYGYLNGPSDFADLSGFIITAVVVVILIIGLFILEIISVISAAVTASRGELFKYPFTIYFIKKSEASVEDISEPTTSDENNSTSSSSTVTKNE